MRRLKKRKKERDIRKNKRSEKNKTVAPLYLELTPPSPQKVKKKQSDIPKRDISEIICYNYNKKGHYVKDYTKPKNYRQS